ncbi:acetylxylan esterase [Paenibacillus sp. KR2-11]|uniref:acetylxylan esterase n=1 Tax=Paenibacillus sp. KR2-11 TaxID=3385500 RepID=UPI0038FC1EA6
MNHIEKRIRELEGFTAQTEAPADLDAFWQETLEESAGRPLTARREEAPSLSPYIRTYRVVYEGYDDTPLHGWFLLPAFTAEPQPEKLPCVVLYHGYTGSKGYPEQHAPWLLMGYAVFAVDVRGQGGESGNALPQTHGMSSGWITQGLLDPRQSYYRAAAVDAVRAVEWAAAQPEVDGQRIITAGVSQGGGLALLTGALSPIPALVLADLPNLCHMDYGILNSTGSLTEAAKFVSRHPEHLDQVLQTLGYFDLLHLADRLHAPVFVSVGLKDTVCLPETVYAVYNRITVPKEIHVFPFNGHHTSGDHFRREVEWIRSQWG